jgi:hypothetical protein
MGQMVGDIIVIRQDTRQILEMMKRNLASNESGETTEVKQDISIVHYQPISFLDDSKVKENIGKLRIHLETGDHQRSFSGIRQKIKEIADNELRKLIVYAGGLKFVNINTGKEFWGLPKRNKKELNFSENDFPDDIVEEIKQNRDKTPGLLAKILLFNPMYNLRTFEMIKQKIDGFSDEELRGILRSIEAVALNGIQSKREYWTLPFRN